MYESTAPPLVLHVSECKFVPQSSGAAQQLQQQQQQRQQRQYQQQRPPAPQPAFGSGYCQSTEPLSNHERYYKLRDLNRWDPALC